MSPQWTQFVGDQTALNRRPIIALSPRFSCLIASHAPITFVLSVIRQRLVSLGLNQQRNVRNSEMSCFKYYNTDFGRKCLICQATGRWGLVTIKFAQSRFELSDRNCKKALIPQTATSTSSISGFLRIQWRTKPKVSNFKRREIRKRESRAQTKEASAKI